MRRYQAEPPVIVLVKRRIYVDSTTSRLRCREIGFGSLGGVCSRLMESVLTFDKASIISSTPLSRSGRPGVRIESVRALTAQTMLRARAQDRVGRAGTRCCGSGA